MEGLQMSRVTSDYTDSAQAHTPHQPGMRVFGAGPASPNEQKGIHIAHKSKLAWPSQGSFTALQAATTAVVL